MVTIRNLQVKYGNQIALSITSPITFEDGDRIGIIGSNGAGKTTLVKSILGLTNYNGSIHTEIKPEQMSVHMQENNYADTMVVKHIIETISNAKIKNDKRLQGLISFFNFEECLNKKFSVLSGGQKQRMTIILVLMQDAPLVFFDEVTSGLDFETRQQLMSKINQWYQDKNTTVCIISHYYEELEHLTNKILLLEKGNVVDFGYKDELFKKYCGKSTITIDNTQKNQELTKCFSKLAAPENLIALSCPNEKIEADIIKLFLDENINFKRSNNDIQIMSINAKQRFANKLKGVEADECVSY